MKISISAVRLQALLLVVLAIVVISTTLVVPSPEAQEQRSAETRFEVFGTADAITRDIRDASRSFARIPTPSEAERTAAASKGRIIADYGSSVVIAVAAGTDLRGSLRDAQMLETTISLPAARLDPIKNPPNGTIAPSETDSGGGRDYFVVQFGAPATTEWLDGLRDAGVEVIQYVPHNAFFVYAGSDAIARAARHSRVRWAGRYMPEQKITADLRSRIRSASAVTFTGDETSPIELTGQGTAVFDVAVFGRADIREVARQISSSYGGTVRNIIELSNNYFNIIRVELPLDRVADLANIPDVITVDPWSRPRIEDERAAQIVAGNYTSTTTLTGTGYDPLTQFGVDGTNVTISMVDDGVSIPGNGGFYVTSANTVNGPLRGGPSGATGGHGHINASIITGSTPFGLLDPMSYNYGLGVAHKAHIVNIPLLTSGYTGDEVAAMSDTVVTPGPNGVNASISNNSWGDGTNNNVYDAYTAQFDGVVRDASMGGNIDPLVLVFSAGNCGNAPAGSACSSQNGLTRPKNAKNLIAVGNSENLRPDLSSAANNLDDLSSSSSRGPSADGRIKPDITAPGTVITGSRAGSCSSVSSCFDANHAWSTGTSHAAPQVAGVAALFTQYWKNANGGTNPSPALVKAAILNTGQEMAGSNATAPIPNGNEGWGRVNMKFMLNTGIGMRYVNETEPFSSPGASTTITGVVSDPTKPIRVALVWTDPPAAPNANPALVNDLDLSVTIGPTTYKGNVFSGGVSVTGGVADNRNNVENVRLPAGTAAGTPFSIVVTAVALNGDGILGNADTTDQNFALVAYNFDPPVVHTVRSRADFDGDGRTDLSVFRPSEGNWYINRSTAGFTAHNFGLSGDIPVPGDYDMDGKADIAIFRPEASGTDPDFYVLNSATSTFSYASWGNPGDIPLSGDFDGDGRTDFTVYRPANNVWYVLKSSGGAPQADPFGTAGDIPFYMDYEADGRSNYGVFRPGTGVWYIAKPTGVAAQNFHAISFGVAADAPVPADYDGDDKDDIAVFRPSTGVWYVLRSSNGAIDTIPFGLAGDVPVPGDYDGDGRDDIAVYRGGTWHLNQSTGGLIQFNFGLGSDVPIPKTYIP